MSINTTNIPEQIRALKRRVREQCPDVTERFQEVEALVAEEVAAIEAASQRGESVIPEIAFSDLAENRVSNETVTAVKRRGAVVLRGVFARGQASDWYDKLGSYLADNGYYEQDDPGLDQYFSDLKAGRPQICAVYWSKPQVEARQGETLAKTRSFLNRLWRYQENGTQHFNPDRECTYVDRVRMRQPGDTTLGLSAHIDGGSVERWLGANYQEVYRSLFEGNWRDFSPFNGASRPEVEGVDSPAVCQAFRTWQGWTALTPQGPRDGTLQLIPTTLGIAYVLLRPFQEDVPEDLLCGAVEGRAQAITEEWHSLLLRGLVSIPKVEPGDTVWWHSDVVHAVEHEHQGSDVSSVIYIGSAPWCDRNMRYLERQKQPFLEGRSAPDFAPEDYEVAYPNRATLDDLTDLGKRQMGFAPWS